MTDNVTIRAADGSNLVIEKLDDGRFGVWTTEPGGNDGRSVILDGSGMRELLTYVGTVTPSYCGCPTGGTFTVHHTDACESRGRMPAGEVAW